MNSGILVLKIVSDDELQKIQYTGRFSGSKWTRGHGELTGKIQAMPARTMPIDRVLRL